MKKNKQKEQITEQEEPQEVILNMTNDLIDFSSVHPMQMLGIKKHFVEDEEGYMDFYNYDIVPTNTTLVLANSYTLDELSKLFFPTIAAVSYLNLEANFPVAFCGFIGALSLLGMDYVLSQKNNTNRMPISYNCTAIPLNYIANTLIYVAFLPLRLYTKAEINNKIRKLTKQTCENIKDEEMIKEIAQNNDQFEQLKNKQPIKENLCSNAVEQECFKK